MDVRLGSDGAGDDRVDALIDVTQVPLAELLASDERVLAAAMRRVLADVEQAREIIAGFSSYAR